MVINCSASIQRCFLHVHTYCIITDAEACSIRACPCVRVYTNLQLSQRLGNTLTPKRYQETDLYLLHLNQN